MTSFLKDIIYCHHPSRPRRGEFCLIMWTNAVTTLNCSRFYSVWIDPLLCHQLDSGKPCPLLKPKEENKNCSSHNNSLVRGFGWLVCVKYQLLSNDIWTSHMVKCLAKELRYTGEAIYRNSLVRLRSKMTRIARKSCALLKTYIESTWSWFFIKSKIILINN